MQGKAQGMASNGNGGKFAHWMSSGLLATVAWFAVLVIYCTFRAFKIEDPLLGQAFLLLTGAWVGNLTLAQGRKNQQVEQKVDKLTQVAKAEHPEIAGELE